MSRNWDNNSDYMRKFYKKEAINNNKIYLTKREIKVLELIHKNKMSITDVAKYMEVTRERVRQINFKALIKIAELMSIFGFELKD